MTPIRETQRSLATINQYWWYRFLKVIWLFLLVVTAMVLFLNAPGGAILLPVTYAAFELVRRTFYYVYFGTIAPKKGEELELKKEPRPAKALFFARLCIVTGVMMMVTYAFISSQPLKPRPGWQDVVLPAPPVAPVAPVQPDQPVDPVARRAPIPAPPETSRPPVKSSSRGGIFEGWEDIPPLDPVARKALIPAPPVTSSAPVPSSPRRGAFSGWQDYVAPVQPDQPVDQPVAAKPSGPFSGLLAKEEKREEARRQGAAAKPVVRPAPPEADTLSGRVVGVADGDTLTVLDQKQKQHKVRLSGIDAPEKSQAFAQRAKQSLSNLAYGRAVSVEWRKRDKYRRIVGKVFIMGKVFEGGRDVNLEQVRRGLAWHYKHYLYEQAPIDRVRYAAAETEARTARRGLWALPEAQRVPPWEWRHGGKQTAQAAPAERTALACGSKRYCREMVSCEEARHYLSACGITRLDGDSDGVPCEALC